MNMRADRVFVFNRRTVEDRLLYVRAKSRKEAWEKARADDAVETSDPEVAPSTYRFIEEQP